MFVIRTNAFFKVRHSWHVLVNREEEKSRVRFSVSNRHRYKTIGRKGGYQLRVDFSSKINLSPDFILILLNLYGNVV